MAKNESIAIVGLAFRLPGDLVDEEQFWSALKSGLDLVGVVDESRWPVQELTHSKRSEPGRSITFSAGVLSRIDEFDAEFFGISPREAAVLDPQQRLLLELSWEAMENAGVVPSSLAGSNCSVYVGISGFDYGIRTLDDLASMTAHSMTGNTLSIAANRLSYVFDLHGPSLAVDTACSSSLVALHHACMSIRSGESGMALVGGVNMLNHPYPFIGFTKASMLSSDGRCKAFDASGDGYVRSEGGAVLLLKPLSKALADGDPIQAVILASGVNADGGRKTGMTIPSRDGQVELMRQVLERADIAAEQVDYVEAHGTGTMVGDPIEAAAIGDVYGCKNSRQSSLPIGSVKTNLGHLEPASGMAGLVKAILTLKHRAVPPSIHLKTPNPNIDFNGLNIEVVTEMKALGEGKGEPLIVGLNSFGFGGANAHLLLQEYDPKQAPDTMAIPGLPPLFLSARSDAALRDMAGRYADILRKRLEPDYYAVAYGAAFRREHLQRRLAIWPGDIESLIGQLDDFSQSGGGSDRLVLEEALPHAGSVAFVYSGNGAQWLGMGRKLLEESQRFATIIHSLDAEILPRSGFSILTELLADKETSRMDDTEVAQPLLFAIQVALTIMLKEAGVQPKAVTGHSVGEVAAAWAAGALTLDQAIEVVCVRSECQAETQGSGRMAAAGLSANAMSALLQETGIASVEVVGFNSPNNVTLAGDYASLMQLKAELDRRGVFFRVLELDYAFHSPAMDPIRERLVRELADLRPGPSGQAEFISTVTGDLASGETLDAQYWWHNVRLPVRFQEAIQHMGDLGCHVFIEIGPHPILQRYVQESLKERLDVETRILPTLKRDDDGLGRVHEVILRAHMSTDMSGIRSFFPQSARPVQLPNYPWQRESFWLHKTTESLGILERWRVHPLLGWRIQGSDALWENVLDPQSLTWLQDHKVGGAIVFPGAGYVEMALAAAREWFGEINIELEEFDILAPIVFDGEHGRAIRLELNPRDGGFVIRSRQRLSDDEWTLNAAGRLIQVQAAPATYSRTEPAGKGAVVVDATQHYRLTGAIGLDYGPSFQGLVKVRVSGQELAGDLVLPESLEHEAQAYLLHPATLDVCFQSLVDFFREDIEAGHGVPLLPVKVGALRLYGVGSPTSFSARLIRYSIRSVLVDFVLRAADGSVVARLDGCRFRAAALRQRDHAEPSVWRDTLRVVPHPVDQLSIECQTTDELVKRLNLSFAERESSLRRTSYFKEALPLFEALTLAFAYDAFKTLASSQPDWLNGLFAAPASIESEAGPLCRWLLDLVREEGLLVERNGRVMIAEDAALPAPDEIWLTLLRDYPDCLPELVLIGRVGRHLPELMTGALDIGLFNKGMRASHPAETLYDDSPAYIGTRLAIQETLVNLAKDWPANRRLRVLDVSCGLSELPRHLAGIAVADRLDYVLAHPDVERRDYLSAEYKDHPFVLVAGLSGTEFLLESDAQLPEQFDVIILRHWLHRMDNGNAALAALRGKLAAGALVLIAERHPDLSADLVSGVDTKWWFEASVAGLQSRLMPPSYWAKTLAKLGFDEVETFVEPASDGLPLGAYLLMAKRPAETFNLEEPAASTWLLLADMSGPGRKFAEQLGLHLESQGQHVVMAQASTSPVDDGTVFDPSRLDAVTGMIGTVLHQAGRIDHVVHMVGNAAEERAAADFPESVASLSLFHLVRALAGIENGYPKLWQVTNDGALCRSAVGIEVDPAQTATWGLGRVVMNEYPMLNCTLIDVSRALSETEGARLLSKELLLPDGETEIVLTRSGRYCLRMEQAELVSRRNAASTSRFKLDFFVPGQLRNLTWLPMAESRLADDEIEVRPVASGLNFRDIMYVMGLLPDEAVEKGFAGASLGLEFSGVVTRIGARVREFTPGDAVMGFGSACFSSHVVTKAIAVAPKPDNWSFEAAATVPTVFFTVYYALHHLADLQPGERVLIHGGAGGVGIAAIQLARYLGAEVFATAGSEEKRDFVHLIGADHVFDSRNLNFADEILEVTGGEGVDVILNSLAGEAIRRNLRILKPFGRFLELGKRDFFENTPIGLRPFKDNISYFGIDADQLLVARPELAGRLFREVMSLFRTAVLSPLPCRVFPAERVVDAFRTMQQARHIGKVVLSLAEPNIQVEVQESPQLTLQFKREATYLVTGGISGFGLESARWLAVHGAGNIVLLGRRGMNTPGATEAVAGLEKLGAKVSVVACDVSERDSLARVLKEIERDMPPLRGILHAAMVLDDALMTNLDDERFKKVLAPKLLGAWHLHSLTQDIHLDHFILYSSITTFIGNPGQANYVAANAYLEGLANMRRNLGLQATCVGWGPIGDVGYLTRNEGVKDSLEARLGAAPLSAQAALSTLKRVIVTDTGPCAVADFDWPTLARYLPSSKGSRYLELHKHFGQVGMVGGGTEDLKAMIVGKSSEEVTDIVRGFVTQEIAQILSIGANRIDRNRSLHELGMDSLMGVELALALEKRSGVQLPAMMLNEGPTVERVTARIVEKLTGDQHADGDAGDGLNALVRQLAAQHGESLSTAELAETASSVRKASQASARLNS